MRRHLFPSLIFVVLAAQAFGAGTALDGLLQRADLWTLKGDDFMRVPEAAGFAWNSSAHESARIGERAISLAGLPVVEAVARFEGGKLSEIVASIYARGDVGDLPKEKFEMLLRGSVAAVSDFTKAKMTVRGKDASNAVKAEGVQWQTATARWLLEYSFTREVKTRDVPFRAEFVRVEITPPARTVSLLESASNTTRAKFSGPMHVKRDLASGDVLIADVPMVDQGQKGYCAVACTERVMRYYGVAVDANEIAQVANSSAEGGTSSAAMLEAIKKLGARLRVRVRPVEEQNVKELLGMVGDYNRAAKKGGADPVPDPGRMIDVGAIYHAMKPDVLKEVRTKNKADLGRFQREVQSHVDAGIPLMWSVMLGLFPEPGVPQSGGGHMRLIIGYNTKTQEVLFTDSWGAGHELKRKPMAEAWTMTMGLTTIEPL